MTAGVRGFLVALFVAFTISSAHATDYVYWGGNRIRRADLTVSQPPPSDVWIAPGSPVAVDTTTQRIYWGDNASGARRIMWGNLDGTGTTHVLLTNVVPQRIDELDIDTANQRIYWADGTNLRIYRSSISSPAVSLLPLSQATIGTLRDIALDTRLPNPKLYWLTGTDIYRCDLNGANPQKLPNSLPIVVAYGMAINPCDNRIVLVGSAVVQQIPTIQAGSIIAVDLADADNPTTLLEDPANGPWAVGLDPRKIALDVRAGRMYWTAASDGTGPATIRRANLDGSSAQVFVQASSSVTWSNELSLSLANTSCAVVQGGGLTWAQISTNVPTGTVKVGCANCNAYHGDTPCTAPLPMLCIKKSGTGFPLPKPLTVSNADQYSLWSGGIIGTTAPIVPPATRAAANTVCVQQFGPDWRVAEFHDGSGWGFQAFGGVGNPSSRFWVDINDQPGALCWQ